METEHRELLREIEDASANRDRTGILFSKVFEIFREHLNTETRTVFPLVSYLSERLEVKTMIDKSKLIVARDLFEDEYEHMLQEHSRMNSLLSEVQELGKGKRNEKARTLAERLISHVRLEEEILYPAAFASGDLISWERELLGQKIRY